MLEIRTLIVGSLDTNAYLLTDRNTLQTYIIDPGDAGEYILDKIQEYNLIPIGIIVTHGHFDHILGTHGIEILCNLPFFMHLNDKFLLNRMQDSVKYHLKYLHIDPPPRKVNHLNVNQELTIGSSTMKIIHLPGHTPGSIGIYSQEDRFIISGDTIFYGGSVGRTDFEYSNKKMMKESIKLILSLPPETKIYPGHGPITDIKTEMSFHKDFNQYV